ncbi:hypothetical protein NC652_013166 [Populus alba x Populus x berolinensis]|nr:hypothetical protein NC652_013166 [Populus alba x Populus x berolinensis]
MARAAGMLNRSPSLKNIRAYLKRMFEVEEAIPRNYQEEKERENGKRENGKENENP